MSRLFNFLPVIAAILIIATVASCTRTCDLGYEGDGCTTPVREKYMGTFSGTRTCGAAIDTFSITVSEVAGDVTRIKITNLNSQGVTAIGNILQNGSVTMARQAYGTGGEINGSVVLNNSKLSISYHLEVDGLPDEDCTWIQN